MSITLGTRLGPYEVIAQIGAGGMGEVYRATDTNLKRQVAIKVLPESVAGDADRLARFQREAEVLACLNHPHVAQIHGLEKFDGTIALVMELVEGQTLADRVAQGAIPVDEALLIAKQTAEALEAAHEQGIIHRDLKPANIKVSRLASELPSSNQRGASAGNTTSARTAVGGTTSRRAEPPDTNSARLAAKITAAPAKTNHAAREDVRTTGKLVLPSTSSSASRTSPADCMRCRRSLRRQRRIRADSAAGVAAGSRDQSGSLVRIWASVSVSVDPSKARRPARHS